MVNTTPHLDGPDLYKYSKHLIPSLMYELFNDYDWALQGSLADMEFEQDEYDDIMYGDSFLSQEGFPNASINVEDIFPQHDYDKLAMKGLRRHATQGLGRYFGPEITGGKKWTDNFATWYPSRTWSNPHRDFRTSEIIDFDIPKILAQTDKGDPWIREMVTGHHPPRSKEEWPYNTYQNSISDIARHEYKHSILDNENPYAHPAIYGTGAQYDLSSVNAFSDLGAFVHPEAYGHYVENYNPDIAGDVVRDVVGPDRDDFRGL